MITEMFYDCFADTYTAERDPYAPPERYLVAHRGPKGTYIDHWSARRGDDKITINVEYSTDEYYNDEIHTQKLREACNKNDCKLIILREFTLPEEKFDEYVERFLK